MGDREAVKALALDYRRADLSRADRAMLDYVVLLTREPHAAQSGAAALREAGFEDAAILDVCQVAAYYNYVNRLAEGLSVQLEEFWSDDMMTLTDAEFEQRRAARKGGD